MNRALLLLSSLCLGLPATGIAQTTSVPPPQAIPAKIALISLEDAVFGSNEGHLATEELMRKYAPRKTQIEAEGKELESLKQQLQNAPATLTDAERANQMKTIDAKEKQWNRDSEDASTGYTNELAEIYNRVAQKIVVVLKTYIVQNGYTMVLDVNKDTNNILAVNPATNLDITADIVKAYNASSAIAAPVQSVPAQSTPTQSVPAATTTPPNTTAPLPTSPSTIKNEHYGSYIPLTPQAKPATQK